MSRLVVLMYHSLYANDAELSAIDAEDRPYALHVDAFAAQLDALGAAGLPVVDPAALQARGAPGGGVVLTFDDGHASNHRHALPALQARGLQASFFVTSDFVERRSGFCTRRDLRELADAGMTVGSHGRTHRFLDDMSDGEAVAEARDSKAALEDCIGGPVTQISFPGGRYRPSQIQVFRGVGYGLFHSSQIASCPAGTLVEGAVLPRLAIRRTTTVAEFLEMSFAAPTWMWRAQALAGAKRALRLAVGNRAYHALYGRLHGGVDA